MIVFMPKYMLAGYTKFVDVGRFVIRLHFKRIWIGDWHSLPFGIFTAELWRRKSLDALANKYLRPHA